MVIIGVDPGTALTGYGFIDLSDRGELSVIDYGVICTPAKDKMEKRLLQLYSEINEKILLYGPQRGAVEKLFFHSNVTTAISVGQARGVILLSLARAGIDVDEFTPMEVKQAVVGYGGAEKRQVQMMVKAILKLNEMPKPDDAADALAIAICCANTNRFPNILESF
ncbi:MAG TPA: crossover junction endodeoxyribonuclease RuvC [Flexilinea sp.]|nr:crossover junction endodeoxyribonuclease RuvC [Flexilinea sp.]